ncbi:MAG TPA: SPOR domain-containing protein [Vicinamibacterales bacterium]|nr:SPOR domain-containing protein [Vicinamibacterales bacterium]
MAAETPDDGFHEIQLNGKQLVFLFMAATVVSVVIFLCGVLVGRGVKAERAATIADGSAATIEPTPQAAATPVAPAAGSDPTTAAPPPTVDDLSYFNRLEKKTPAVEELKAPPAAAPVAVAPAPTPKPAPVPPVAAQSVPAPPTGDGYAVQVAVLDHPDADAMAKRLSSKGYNAFIVPLGQTSPPRYRVRIGKFKTKHEAETVAAKLQREEQFKPWITR